MPPTSRYRLLPRSGSAKGHYVIIFALLGSLFIIGAAIWGYLLPSWRKRHPRPVKTRYNCVGGTQNHIPLEQDLELPVVFPPHPAVILPLNRKPKSDGQARVTKPSPIPVYDPRTQSPFPNIPNGEPSRPSIAELSTNNRTTLIAGTPMNPRYASLKRPDSHKSRYLNRHALFSIWRTRTGYARFGHRNDDGVTNGSRSLFVARSAGAPPLKPKAIRLASKRLSYQAPCRNLPDKLSASTLSTVGAPDHQNSARNHQQHRIEKYDIPRAGSLDNHSTEGETSNSLKRSICTPGQTGRRPVDIFATPSSLETTGSTPLASATNPAGLDSTPLTAPDSFTYHPRGEDDLYPGIPMLVPARRFKGYRATASLRHIPRTDLGSQDNPCFSGEACSMSRTVRTGHRAVSAPPSSSGSSVIIDGDLAEAPSLRGLDFIADIQVHPALSIHSSNSSPKSSTLLPRPLTLGRTMRSQSPFVSPSPLRRYVQNVAFPNDSLRREFAAVRPVTRGKSPKFKRQFLPSTTTCLSNEGERESKISINSLSQNLEQDPFVNSFGSARLQRKKRHSSLGSLSPMRDPDSSTRRFSSGGSCIFSRKMRNMSVVLRPELAGGSSSSFQPTPEPDLRRTRSFDETIFRDLDWARQSINDTQQISAVLFSGKEDCLDHHGPQVTSYLGDQIAPGTPRFETTSSYAFGKKFSVLEINLARRSDDVFGGDAISERRNGYVIQDGKVIKNGRVIELKVNQEDLAMYGGRAAPGGAGWL